MSAYKSSLCFFPLLLIVVLNQCFNPVLAEARLTDEQGNSHVLPPDLVFSRKQIRSVDKPAVSNDGLWLAYELYSPQTHTTGSERYLSNGVPSDVIGLRLFVVSVQDGVSRAVCGEKSNCWRPSWSPNGRLLAYFSDSDGFPQLWVYDANRQTSRRVAVVRIKARPWWIDKPAWSPDSREIFVPVDLATPVGADEKASAAILVLKDAPTVQVYRSGKDSVSELPGISHDPLADRLIRENNSALVGINVNSGKMRVIVPADSEPRPSCLKLSPDGHWISYLSVFKLKGESQSQVYYDLTLVKSGGGQHIPIDVDLELTDRDYLDEPYLWSQNGKQLIYTKGKRLWVVGVGSEVVQKPHWLGENLGELNDQPFVLTGDGKAVLVGLKPKDENAYSQVPSSTLALVPLDGSEPKLLDAQGIPITRNSITLWQPQANTIYLLESDERTAEQSVVRLDINTASTATVWSGQGRITVAGAGPESDSIIIRFENLTTPPDFFHFTPNRGWMKRLTRVEPRLANVSIGSMEIIETTIPSFSGHLRAVRSSVFLPPGAQRGDPLPTIVSFYGGSASSADAQAYGGGARFSIPIQVFVTRGYAVLIVDSPLGPEGNAGNPIQEMADAILPQVYHAAALGYTDITRVAIAGHSYGAYATAGLLTHTNLFRAGIALDGIYDLAGNYAHMNPDDSNFAARWSETGQGRMGTHPWADLKRYIANSPYFLADRLNTPLLLIHGENDDTCPVEESRKMFHALKRLNKTAELATYAGEGHTPGNWSPANSKDVVKRILAFLDHHVMHSD